MYKSKKEKKSAAFIFGEDKKLQNGDFPHDCSFTSLYVYFHFFADAAVSVTYKSLHANNEEKKKIYLIRGEEEDFAQIKKLQLHAI